MKQNKIFLLAATVLTLASCADDNFQDFRIALDVDLFGGIDHFLCLVAGCQGEGKDCDKQQVRN